MAHFLGPDQPVPVAIFCILREPARDHIVAICGFNLAIVVGVFMVLTLQGSQKGLAEDVVQSLLVMA